MSFEEQMRFGEQMSFGQQINFEMSFGQQHKFWTANEFRRTNDFRRTKRMGNALQNVSCGLFVRSHSRVSGGTGVFLVRCAERLEPRAEEE